MNKLYKQTGSIFEYPKIIIDKKKLYDNCSLIINRFAKKNITVNPVIKALAGFMPAVLPIVSTHPACILDSCIHNLHSLGNVLLKKNIQIKTGIIKLPSQCESESFNFDKFTPDYQYVSDISHIDMVAKYYNKGRKKTGIIIMADSGDLREGVPLNELDCFLKKALAIKNADIKGIATNHACFSGIVPTNANLNYFMDMVEKAEKRNKFEFEIISGGNSSLIGLIENNKIPERINNVRIGEAILLGTDVLTRQPIKWLNQGVFKARAEILEYREKEAIIEGIRTQNAFGEILNVNSSFTGGKLHKRALLNLGKRHFMVNGIKPLNKGIYVVGASSDYTILDMTGGKEAKHPEFIELELDYPALMSVMQVIGKNINFEII